MQADSTPIQRACKAVGGQSAMAGILGPRISAAQVNQWCKGSRPLPLDHCVAIERITDGAFAVETLRDDIVWQRVPDPAWPHPDGRPCVDVAAPVAA